MRWSWPAADQAAGWGKPRPSPATPPARSAAPTELTFSIGTSRNVFKVAAGLVDVVGT